MATQLISGKKGLTLEQTRYIFLVIYTCLRFLIFFTLSRHWFILGTYLSSRSTVSFKLIQVGRYSSPLHGLTMSLFYRYIVVLNFTRWFYIQSFRIKIFMNGGKEFTLKLTWYIFSRYSTKPNSKSNKEKEMSDWYW